jgi:hypothetical protein
MRKLKVFYGDACAITFFIIDVKTCEFLLKLGSIYHVNAILSVCDEFLASLISHKNDMVPLEKKLFLADEYNISESKVRLKLKYCFD